VIGFNYDMAEGVEYRIDLERPAGDRIRDLRWHGQPLAPDQKLRIALNNYRAAGSAGYSMFSGAKIVWRSGEEIRDLIVRYFTERKALPERATGNWSILPDVARRVLLKEAMESASRQQLQ
jgi:2',3'-cyclic-nucleotide 2'-phosphodiesterase/3'-nucleotidase